MSIRSILKIVAFFLAAGFISCNGNAPNTSPLTTIPVTTFTHPDHIIFVWLENKGFDQMVDNPEAPYINSLAGRGTLFTDMNAITHPSYPNYVDFFAGQPNGITTDSCIHALTLTTPNLYTALQAVHKSFAWYSEDLPSTGSTECIHNKYVEKHNPITLFANVPKTANKRFADFPRDYNKLENVVCISPNLLNDMHDGTIAQADTWLREKLSSLVDWCMSHNSIFVIYFDESESPKSNRIPVIAVGQNVRENYRLGTSLDHFNWTRTICSMFQAPNAWTQNIRARQEITDCWK